jgi:hypothetical protein
VKYSTTTESLGYIIRSYIYIYETMPIKMKKKLGRAMALFSPLRALPLLAGA